MYVRLAYVCMCVSVKARAFPAFLLSLGNEEGVYDGEILVLESTVLRSESAAPRKNRETD